MNTRRTTPHLLRAATLLGVALAAAGLNACVFHQCTELGCEFEDVAAFALSDRANVWASEQDALYRFTVSFDGMDHVCEGVVGDGIPCDSDAIGLMGFHSGGEEDGFDGIDSIEVYSYPGPTHLTVERDGVVVFERGFDIDPVVDEPNGGGCGTCEYWSAEVTW